MARPKLTAVPAARSSLPILKIRRRVFLTLLIIAATLGLFSGLAWLLSPSEVTVPERPRDESAIALAATVANDFVKGLDTAVPTSSDVSGQFSKQGPAVPGGRVEYAGALQYRIGDVQALTIEQVTFLVTGKTPEDPEVPADVYELSVAMGLGADGWVLTAAPTIIPAKLAPPMEVPGYKDLFQSGGDGSTLSELPNAEAIRTQVEKWAQVFAAEGRSSDGLFAITGTNNSEHSFDGLGGWSVEAMSIKSWLSGENSAETAAEFGDTWVVIRVALVLNPPATKGASVSAEYDLLLQPGKNPAAPPVTAWGPAGTGPTLLLTNYVNNTTSAPVPEQE